MHSMLYVTITSSSTFVCRLLHSSVVVLFFFFFFNDTATTEIYTLSLHDALPIYIDAVEFDAAEVGELAHRTWHLPEIAALQDRKSTRLNSSHVRISYAVFCLKKKKKKKQHFYNVKC